MTILGKFTKQPREIETYSIQFAEDMTATDNIVGGYGAIALPGAIEVDLTAPYTVGAEDNNKLFYTGFNVTLPSGLSDGFVVMVSNTDQDSQITVTGFNIPARGCIVIRRKAGAWVSEMSAICIVVAVPGDQRIRMTFTGGANTLSYKGQMSALTSEGRVLEDELTIRIKET
jgi:hypothetical protein